MQQPGFPPPLHFNSGAAGMRESFDFATQLGSASAGDGFAGMTDALSMPMGVDALLQDFGEGSAPPLEFDFNAAEELLLDGNTPGLGQQQSMDLDGFAVLSNIAAAGAAVRPLVPGGAGGYGGIPAPAWRAWSPSDGLADGLAPSNQAQSSSEADQPIPGSSHPQLPGGAQAWLQPERPAASAAPQAAPEPAAAGAAAAPPAGRVQTRRGNPARAAEQAAAATEARERERAEKVKEKNKRAQRKFRQRQKDRRESAERTAMELAEQLQRVQAERDSLAQRAAQLEAALQAAGSAPVPREPQEPEPTFYPARGWSVFNPFEGLVLTAICNPPHALTHRQMMSLSLRDLTKLMAQLVRRLSECLDAIRQQSPNPTAEARIQALLCERHALMAWTAINRPKLMYQILTTKLTDPPEPNCARPPREHWLPVLDELGLSGEQLQTLCETRRLYIARCRGLILQRQELGRRMQDLEQILTDPGFAVNEYHLKWSTLVQQLQANLIDLHKTHTCLMVRVWYKDCFTPVQVAKILTAFAPYPFDIYEILRELLVRRAGEPPFAEYLAKGLGSLSLEQEAQRQCRWPGPFLTPEAQAALEARHQQQPEGGVSV